MALAARNCALVGIRALASIGLMADTVIITAVFKSIRIQGFCGKGINETFVYIKIHRRVVLERNVDTRRSTNDKGRYQCFSEPTHWEGF